MYVIRTVAQWALDFVSLCHKVPGEEDLQMDMLVIGTKG